MNDSLLRTAYGHHQTGNHAEALRLYREVLRTDPKHFDALCLLGLLHWQRGELEDAGRAADAAIQSKSATPNSSYNLGYLLQGLGRHSDALTLFDKALAARPQYFEALVHRGISFLALEQAGDALAAFDLALALRPNEAGLWNNRGNALMWLGRYDDAVESYDRAIALKRDYADAWGSRGHALLALARYDDALASYDKALAAPPGSATLWSNRGLTLLRLKRHTDAIASFDKSLAIDPRRSETLFQRGNALSELRRYEEALASLDASLAVMPDNPDAFVSRGAALAALGRSEDALACYDRALSIKPDCIEALINRGTVLFENWRLEEAVRDYEQVLVFNSDFPYIRGNLALYRLNCCDWRALEDDRRRIHAGLLAGKPVILPFADTALSISMMEQFQCARLWAKRELPAVDPVWRGERYRHQRIRVAYLSADFHHHATMFLMAGVFEHHDRAQFETIAVSYGPDDGSAMRVRAQNGFDRFLDVRGKSDFEIAALLRQMEIDIAVDLKGYTQHSRPGILAHRPAAVQAQYLGSPGTMGTSHVDYVIADEIVIPEKHRLYFSEKIAYLPDSYQCNDSKRHIADITPSRAAAGLPEDGFVYCSFNNSYKIMPDVFAAWIRLLHSNDRAVLWLLQYSTVAMHNLRREAEAAGVSPERLVFAPPLPHEEHLARMRLADLFLDTLPYNAHTTASDALWAGLPVLTILGNTFAGRVGASLLNAVGLPEMIADSLGQYESLAGNLSADPATLAAVRTKLARNREKAPLFDTARFTRNLEALYTGMWARSLRGERPETFFAGQLAEPAPS